jgi:hypothetical protein
MPFTFSNVQSQSNNEQDRAGNEPVISGLCNECSGAAGTPAITTVLHSWSSYRPRNDRLCTIIYFLIYFSPQFKRFSLISYFICPYFLSGRLPRTYIRWLSSFLDVKPYSCRYQQSGGTSYNPQDEVTGYIETSVPSTEIYFVLFYMKLEQGNEFH